MTDATKVNFLVIGGGIGGLAAALGVAESGVNVCVLEQAPEFGEIGAGLQLGPNATAVLDRFGLLEEVSQHAVFPQRLVLKDAMSGQELTALDLGESFRKRYGYPYIVTHRSDLHFVLLNACRSKENIELLTNKQVESVENLGTQVRVCCSDGSVYMAEAVIGADGLWSTTRQLFNNDKPICSEYVAYRGTIPVSELDVNVHMDDVVAWIGPYLHLVQYPVRRKELFNQVAVFKSFRYQERTDDWGTPEELDEQFSVCCPQVRHAVTYMNRGRRWPMYDREPIDNWTAGRVTLLGDAAHPMLQYLAQGACQALEDAACLTEKLKSHQDNIEQAFLDYQKERIPRTAQVQQRARVWGDFWHTDDQIALILRERILRQRSVDDYRDVDWLYAYRGWEKKDNS